MGIEIIVTGAIGLVSTIVSSWVSWVFARRKYNSEVDSNLIHNMQEGLEYYKQLSDDNKTRIKEVLDENKQLFDENKQLRKDLEELKSQMNKLATSICYDLSCQLRKREYSTLNMEENEEANPKTV